MSRRPTWRSALVIISLAAVLGVYLFVQAPAPLAASTDEAGTVPIRTVFALLEHENDVARALWTEDIVEAGKTRGLTFEEAWRERNVHSGPLPALFLRETAAHLEREAAGLRLFLGSEHPINSANKFTGEQSVYFARLAEAGAPQFFFEAATGLHTAMFSDRAITDACMRCHNEHDESPKHDWKLHDIMGATTWMYPQEMVSTKRALELIDSLRRSIRAAYASYLDKAITFPNPPRVGEGWPKDGRQLPTVDAFMRELAQRSSSQTLRGLLEPGAAELLAETPPPAPPPPKAAAAPPPAPASKPDDTLVIRAKRATRVTVDHNGTRLVVARMRSGAITSVTSAPPLKVQVDDVESVTLEYRGKSIAGSGEVEVVDARATRDSDGGSR